MKTRDGSTYVIPWWYWVMRPPPWRPRRNSKAAAVLAMIAGLGR